MMLPLNKPTLLVEVNLQDVFASNSSSIKGDAATNYQIAQAKSGLILVMKQM